MSRTKQPSADPRINVPVPRILRARAQKKAKGEGKNMKEVIVSLLKGYVESEKAAA